MAYNKDNYEHNRLTPKQEKFVDSIMQGKTQRQAYYDAYESSRKWKDYSVDIAASQLMENDKVKMRLQELGWKDHKKVEWTRRKALETINYVMDMNRKDIERIEEACNTEIDIYESRLNQKAAEMAMASKSGDVRGALKVAKEMQDITEIIQELKKQKRMNDTNVRGIFEGAKILNRMFGYDITKVEVNVDEERDEMNKLTAEELKEILRKV